MIQKLIFLGLLLLSAGVSASTWTVRYQENGHWRIDTFQRAKDGWQDLVRSKIYSQSNFLEAQNVSQTGQELRGTNLNSEIWTATEKWSLYWETQFSNWVATQVDSDFFIKYGLKTDCADVYYGLRWIFARIHKLEMAVRLAGSGDYFTHRSVRNSWEHLPTSELWHQDQKFLAALDYVLQNTYTHSLMEDAYPVEITAASLRPGVFHLELHSESGHTQVIYRTAQEQPDLLLPFLILQSTTPRAVRDLMVDGYWTYMQPVEKQGGFLRLRWPDFTGPSVQLMDPSVLPFYSKEQYQPGFLRSGSSSFFEEVYLRLNPSLKMSEVVRQGYLSLKKLFIERVNVVRDGYDFCTANPCPEGSENFEGWSTPSRDSKISKLYRQTMAIQDRQGPLSFDIQKIFREPFLEFSGVTYSLEHLLMIWSSESYSWDPRDLPEKRWGVSGAAASRWIQELVNASHERQSLLEAGQLPLEWDKKYSSARFLDSKFCSTAPLSECGILKSNLQSLQSTIGNETLSLKVWLERSLWFVSALGAKGSYWGEHAINYDWLSLNLGAFQSFFHKNWMLTLGVNSWELFQSSPRGGILLESNKTSKLAVFVEGSTALVEANGDSIRALSLEDSKETSTRISFVPTKILSFGNAFLVANEKTMEFALGRIENNQLIWIEQGPAVWFSLDLAHATSFAKIKSFVYGTSSGTRVWDFSQNLPKFYDLQNKQPIRVTANNSRWLILGGVGLINKDTSQFYANPETQKIQYCHSSGRSCFAVNDQAPYFRLVELLQDGQFKLIQELNNVSGDLNESLVIDWKSPDTNQAYLWKETELVPLQPLSDESLILNKFGDYFLTRTKSESQRIRKDSEVIFETKDRLGFIGKSDNEIGLFEEYGLNFSQVKVRSLKEPRKILTTSLPKEIQFRMGGSVPGALTISGLWIQ